ncbi:TetR/AcrR family transcriptional regulator [Radiobacillus sp. PE A8.2]|uniref:TetR/AcrR family transcriptional regulator n=1 Tax=Radiobacillus sp. PE A8.2 TaxID=3380349 RepID=UPI00388F4D65
MNEKKRKIIETSIKLFAEKGFHVTSIQEIADQSNVSKGAFYLYFDSKEALVLAIFDYYFQQIMEKMQVIDARDLEPMEKLKQHIAFFLNMISEHKEYIIMHIRDNLQLGKNLDEFMVRMNKHFFNWMRETFVDIYGEKITPYIVDAAIQLDGLMQGYFKWLAMHDLDIDCNETAGFIVRRFDNCVQGMLNDEAKPQITMDQLQYSLVSPSQQASISEQVQLIVETMLEKLHKQPMIDNKKRQELQEAAAVINDEINNRQPKMIVIQAMLTPFQTVPALKEDCKQIAEICDIRLFLQD